MFAIEMQHLINQCTYKPGWSFKFGIDGDKVAGKGRPWLQLIVSVESDATLCSVARDGTRTPWSSGKRYLSYHMCRQEIIGALFDAIRSAEEHELREWFRYRERAIYNNHIDPDALVELCKRKENFNMRDNAMSMKEAN